MKKKKLHTMELRSSGKSTSTKRTVTIKDYVQPKTKYSLQESREIIEVFSKDFGFNEIVFADSS